MLDAWWKCVIDPYNYLPTPKIKIKPKTWNSFLKNTKGTYNKYNFDGNYQKALCIIKEESIASFSRPKNLLPN
jgi:hypothetical protein